MIKAIIMFVFGNAVWDWLVEFFGSTEDVVKVALLTVIVFMCIKFFKQFIIGVAVIAAIVFVMSR